MEKKFLNLFLALLLVLLLPKINYGQKRGDLGIGKADMYVILLLHPAMIDYDIEKQAFLMQRDKVALQKAKSEENKNSEEIKNIQLSMKKIKAKMLEEEKKYMQKTAELNSAHIQEIMELATGAAEVSKISFNQAIKRLDAQHYSKMTTFGAEYSIAEEKLMKLKEFGFNDGYTTPEETRKKLESIVAEVNAYIKRVAGQKGVSIVLNSGYRRVLKGYARKKDFGIDNSRSLGSIFKTSFPQELLKDDGSIRGYYESINQRTYDWLNNAGYILNHIKDSSISSDILLGGVDLTADVLASLYKAYKLDPNISNAVIQSSLMY